MPKYITIIGSRNISIDEFQLLKQIASSLYGMGYILRSGGADGADSTINHLTNIEVYIPWNGFNNFQHNGRTVFELSKLPDQQLARNKAIEVHPRPDKLSQGALKLHTRNIYQVIGFRGQNGVKSDAVIFCAENDSEGLPIGGTRTAVAYARQLGIPIYNIRYMRNKYPSEGKLLSELLGRIGGYKNVRN